MTRTGLPKFKTPPVNEVAMGVKFEPIEGLTLAHFGLFWGTLRDEFTRSEEAIPLGTPTDMSVRKGGLPLPRLWLIQNDEKYLIQLQPDIFYFNWRKRDDKQKYPSYDYISPLFRRYLKLYFELLDRETLPVPEEFICDLTYVNLIAEQVAEPKTADLNYLFPDFSWRQLEDRALPRPKAVNWISVFDLAGGAVELSAKIQTAKSGVDDSPVLRFEIKASSGNPRLRLEETEKWFDLAHRAIVTSFADLTSDEAQRELWRRIDDPN